MPNSRNAHYKDLGSYKYKLIDEFYYETDLKPINDIRTDYIDMDINGLLTIKKDYAWDGPSGPTVDTHSFMRGSLVHDALYQLMREKWLDCEKDRKYADELLKKICQEDGMSKIRSWYVYRAVRSFGKPAATPGGRPHGERDVYSPPL